MRGLAFMPWSAVMPITKPLGQISPSSASKRCEEAVRQLSAWRLLVLDVVGQGDVQQVQSDLAVNGEADLHRV